MTKLAWGAATLFLAFYGTTVLISALFNLDSVLLGF
jgi:hypothetical protein